MIYPDIKIRFNRVSSAMAEAGSPIFIAQGYRSSLSQAKLFMQGRSTPGKIVTWALPGSSWHEYGLALDCAFKGAEPYSEDHDWDMLGRIGKAAGFAWGGDWIGKKNDRPHLELTYGLSLIDCKDLFNRGGVVAVWSKIDQIRGVQPGREWYGPQLKG